jgi:thymidine phosphorylase
MRYLAGLDVGWTCVLSNRQARDLKTMVQSGYPQKVQADFLKATAAGLSEPAWRLLGVNECDEGDEVPLRHAAPLESVGHVRANAYGRRLAALALGAVITDLADCRNSRLRLAAFVTACAGDLLDIKETVALSRAIVDASEHMDWKESVGDGQALRGWPARRLGAQAV